MKLWSFGFLVLRHSFCRDITGVRSLPDCNAAFCSGNDRKGLCDLQSSLRAELPLAISSHLWHLSGSWQFQLTAYGFLSYFFAAQPLPNTSISLFSECTYSASGTSFVSIFDCVWDKSFWLAYHAAYCWHRPFRCAVHGAQGHNCKVWHFPGTSWREKLSLPALSWPCWEAKVQKYFLVPESRQSQVWSGLNLNSFLQRVLPCSWP